MHPFDRPLNHWLSRTGQALKRHPRRVSGAALALLLGSAMTAFGVAPMTPTDSAPVATRIVTDTLAAQDVGDQLEALSELALTLHRNDLTRRSDSADTLLRRLGIDDPQAAEFLRRDRVAQRVLMGRSGKQVQVRSVAGPAGGQLQEMVVRGPASDASHADTHFNRLTITRSAQGLVAQAQDVPLQTSVREGAGTIASSLFGAADDAGLPDAVTMQLADIFGSDIDFRRELRKGDTFAVVYETLTADGEAVTWNSGTGRVLSARFINDGHSHEAIWFQDSGQRGGYYGPDGLSKARSFLASPLAFSRVTSGFAMRFHPILQQWRQHLGVDYGAPTGTPVRVVGDGVVEFAGVQNGYGNVVLVRHRGDQSTAYAHLSRIDVRKGETVAQGARLGAVGATGWATGPHLHFEFKRGGQQVDPVRMARNSEAVVLSAAARPRFDAVVASTNAQLSASLSQAGSAVARME